MKRAFTLIEMLAVVVILGVLATVTTLTVTNLIEKSKVGTFRDSGLSLIKVSKEAYLEYAGSDMKVDLNNLNIVIDSINTGEKLVFNGKTPEVGEVHIYTSGDVTLYMFDGSHCAYKKMDEKDVTVEKIKTATLCKSKIE